MKTSVGAIVVDFPAPPAKTTIELPPSALRDALEDAIDLRDAVEMMARIDAGNESTVPWENVKVRLGL